MPTAEDPLGTADLRTHTLALGEAPHGCAPLRAKRDGAIKVVLKP